MDNVLIIILIAVGFLSFIPVVKMNKSNDNVKYRCLKYLINAAFVWTILIFLERTSNSMTIIYYSHVLGFPLKFLLASLMVCTIFNYIEKRMPKVLLFGLGFLFIIEFLLGVTNSETGFLLNIDRTAISGFSDMYEAVEGPVFIYHLILTYMVVLIGVVYLFYFLAKHRDVRQYKSITQTMAISVVVVLLVNVLQFAVIKTTVDLTYISLVIVSFALYQVIYTKDMVFNLKSSGRGEILSNMREMYILTDAEKNVIEISKLLLEKYEVNSEIFLGKNLDMLLGKLSESIVFYREYQVDTEDNTGKNHFHLREKKFSLKGMDNFGFMILLYDETQVFTLLRELNKLSNYDNMTGLNNRNYIEKKLEELNHSTNIGVISLDLNGLKANNDYLGHERGDFLLKSLATKMKLVMSEYSNKEMARIGGDEFLITLLDTNGETLKTIKEKILLECEDDDLEKLVSVSIGTAFSKDEANVFALVQEADAAMYAMKKLTSKGYSEQIVEYVKKQDKFIR